MLWKALQREHQWCILTECRRWQMFVNYKNSANETVLRIHKRCHICTRQCTCASSFTHLHSPSSTYSPSCSWAVVSIEEKHVKRDLKQVSFPKTPWTIVGYELTHRWPCSSEESRTTKEPFASSKNMGTLPGSVVHCKDWGHVCSVLSDLQVGEQCIMAVGQSWFRW